MYDPQNIFARILRKELPAQVVYEDEHVLAFHDIYPKAPIHVLVIPKAPYISFDDFVQKASGNEIQTFFQCVQKVAAQLKLAEPGYRLVMNHGSHGGQEVPHLHVHILGGGPLSGKPHS